MCEPPVQDDDDLDMEALKRYVEAGERRAAKGIRVSHWDAPNESQLVQELMIAEELAKSLKEQGRAEIREIEPNPIPNELPDCHARLDGKPIGIEVTELIEPFQHWTDWPLERFREKLAASIDKKDRKAGKPERAPALSRLYQLWLVIATDERLLTPELIEEHLAWIRLTKPAYFDAVFVLGPYEPTENAVVEGRSMNRTTSVRATRRSRFNGSQSRSVQARRHQLGEVFARVAFGGSWPRPDRQTAASLRRVTPLGRCRVYRCWDVPETMVSKRTDARLQVSAPGPRR